MEPTLNGSTLQMFFGWAPLVLGLVIYLVAFLGKRNEFATNVGTLGETYACAQCGRRGTKEHMLPQTHDGAVSYVCSKCGGAH